MRPGRQNVSEESGVEWRTVTLPFDFTHEYLHAIALPFMKTSRELERGHT